MRYLFILVFFVGCASQKDPVYRQDPRPAYSQTRNYSLKPAELLSLAETILRQRLESGSPDLIKEDRKIATDWIVSQSRDKYLLVDFNSVPKRIPLRVRRKYAFVFEPSLAGSTAKIEIVEEVEEREKNGSPKGWHSQKPDAAMYQKLFSELDLAVNSR